MSAGSPKAAQPFPTRQVLGSSVAGFVAFFGIAYLLSLHEFLNTPELDALYGPGVRQNLSGWISIQGGFVGWFLLWALVGALIGAAVGVTVMGWRYRTAA